MCLLIKQNVNTVFTLADFENFCNKNPDGFGMAVPTSDGVAVFKLTPEVKPVTTTAMVCVDDYDDGYSCYSWAKTGWQTGKTLASDRNNDNKPFAKDCFELWEREAKGKDASLHFRFRTHGDICDENTHPYKVLSKADGDAEDVWLMHNGTLNTGNQMDKTKSDTWHFVEFFLKPILKTNPFLLETSPGVRAFIEHYIGTNKLTITTKNGVLQFNKHAWSKQKTYDADLSNDYAWTKPYVAPVKTARNFWNEYPTEATAAQTKRDKRNAAAADKRKANAQIVSVQVTSTKAPQNDNVDNYHLRPAWAKELKYQGLCWAYAKFGVSPGYWSFRKGATVLDLQAMLRSDAKGFLDAMYDHVTNPTTYFNLRMAFNQSDEVARNKFHGYLTYAMSRKLSSSNPDDGIFYQLLAQMNEAANDKLKLANKAA